jgi:predicted Zn-dependent protease
MGMPMMRSGKGPWRWLLPLAALIGAAGQSPDNRAQVAYDKANSLFEQKNLPGSLAALEEALGVDPDNVPALTLKAKIAISVNRPEIAGECLERAVAADPASWYAHFLYGFWYYLRGDYSRAISELASSRKLNPKDARSPLYLGMAYERIGDAQNTMTYYGEALRLEDATGTPDPYTLVANSRALQLLGRLDECTKILSRALKLYPTHRDVQYELGRLLLKQGDAKGAVKAGEAALQLPIEDVTDLQIHYLLARAYQASGDAQHAAQQAAAIRAARTQEAK